MSCYKLSYFKVLFPLTIATECSSGVIPVLHKQSNNLMSLFFKEVSCNGGVNTTR